VARRIADFPVHALTIAFVVLAGTLYVCGLRRLWGRAGAGRAVTFSQAALFGTGLLVLGIALLGPLHHYAERLLWVHMVQHEVLMVLAAPLIMLGRPIATWTWALPAPWRGWARVPRVLGDAGIAWALHAAAIWLWHVPAFFLAAVSHPWLHVAQHASFFVTAVLFWWSLRDLRGMLSLFTTMLHTGALGALMALSRVSWYPGYALEDQQLAGLVMWVPAGLAYPLAALFLGSQWLRRSAA
jgi:putative membrane protein